MYFYRNAEMHMPQTLLFGQNSINALSSEVKKLGKKKVLFVTDKVMQQAGYVEKVRKLLEEAGVDSVILPDVSGEPRDIDVEKGLKVYKESNCDFLLGLGGGSPIDTAKAIGILATNGGKISDYMGADKVKNPLPPLIAIATTAGTGSEVTKFTIIADTKNDVKMLIGDSHIVPTISISDPMFTLSVPPKTTAATGIDAFCHAAEAYTSKKSQPLTDTLAISAIKLISENLRQAWCNGNNLEARTNMMLAATQAGLAFSNASVTLIHGMSRCIGAIFHVPHGISNAVLLPVWAEFTYIANPEKFADIAFAMGENLDGLSTLDAAYKAYEAMKRLCKDIEIPSIEGLGINKDEFEKYISKMAHDAIVSGSPGNNARNVNEETIIELYKKAW
ncbi:iron-containing alcohol dehydrogenase [Tepidanaerobacter sp. EBM-49]|uniref:iron-containing alcohol dehydrogenase n=1 Tax=Tepidanaerobacter sp. EBM-49 TaxID=1918504 RepID=UPI000ACDFF65|nr:iron-containing alcohol dehydrogenase [Tepidanaerobacter sp. EBM-49]